MGSSQLGSQGGGGAGRAAALLGAEHPAAAPAPAPSGQNGAAHLLCEGQRWGAALVLSSKAGDPSCSHALPDGYLSNGFQRHFSQADASLR